MSYQVIARKYRPQRFADVVGQEHVTQTLANAIKQSRIAHAYLFVGPRGTGKTTLARIFAKCLNCTGGPKVDFTDDDPRCQEIAEGRSLDVLEIDGASNRGIEEVRELRETVKYAPAASRFKIYIIDEVHMLTKEAFNALLKTLEEPPAHAKFMFATTEPEKVLPTILSRCQRFDLRRIPAALIARHLAQIAKLEGVQIDEPALHAIARGADGGMRDAESALDQVISFCGEKIVESDVLSMFGLTARHQVFALTSAILVGDAKSVLSELDGLAKCGKDLHRLLGDVLGHVRNLLLFKISDGDPTILEASEAELGALKEQSKGVSVEALTRILDILSEYEWRLKEAASKRILMEVALLKAVQVRHSVSVDAILEKLQGLRAESAGSVVAPPMPSEPERKVSTPAAVPVARQATTVTLPAPEANETVVAPSAPMTATPAAAGTLDLAELWGKIVESVGRASPFARTYLLEAHPVSLVKNLFTIGFSSEFADHLGLVDNPKNRTLIETKLRELGLADVHVKFMRAEAPEGWKGPAPAPPVPPLESAEAPRGAAKPETPSAQPVPKEDFKNDPLIRQALEIFKGQIVEVRA